MRPGSCAAFSARTRDERGSAWSVGLRAAITGSNPVQRVRLGGLDGFAQRPAERVGHARGEVRQQLVEVLREDGDVLLLAPQRDDLTVLARLQVEDPVAGLADGAGDEEVGVVEAERFR